MASAGQRISGAALDVLGERRQSLQSQRPQPISMLCLLRERVAAADIVHVQDAIYAT